MKLGFLQPHLMISRMHFSLDMASRSAKERGGSKSLHGGKALSCAATKSMCRRFDHAGSTERMSTRGTNAMKQSAYQ